MSRHPATDAHAVARPRGAAATGGRSPALRWLVPGLIVAAVVIAAVLAIVLPGTNGPTTGGSSSVPPSSSSSTGPASAGSAGSGAVKAPTITGAQLPTFENPEWRCCRRSGGARGQRHRLQRQGRRDHSRRSAEGRVVHRPLVSALPGRGPVDPGVGERRRRAAGRRPRYRSRPASTRRVRTTRRKPGSSARAGPSRSSPTRRTASPGPTVSRRIRTGSSSDPTGKVVARAVGEMLDRRPRERDRAA